MYVQTYDVFMYKDRYEFLLKSGTGDMQVCLPGIQDLNIAKYSQLDTYQHHIYLHTYVDIDWLIKGYSNSFIGMI